MTPGSSAAEPARGEPIYRLILFVAGGEPNSVQAKENLDRICANHLEGRCEVQVVDVLTNYRTALQHNVLVTPCLLKLEPKPRALVAGTLGDLSKVIAALQLPRA